MENITAKISELEKQLNKLKNQKAAYESMPVEKQLAETLHEKLCRWNHTDGCDWFYGSWDKPTSSHHQYLNKAIEILKITDGETALKIAEILR